MNNLNTLNSSLQPPSLDPKTQPPVWAFIGVWWPAIVVSSPSVIDRYSQLTQQTDLTLILVRVFPAHRYAWAKEVKPFIRNEWFFANNTQHRSELFQSIAYAMDYFHGKFHFPIDGTFCIEKILSTKLQNGQVLYFVKFVGWTDHYNRWIRPSIFSKFLRKHTPCSQPQPYHSQPPAVPLTPREHVSPGSPSQVIVIDDPGQNEDLSHGAGMGASLAAKGHVPPESLSHDLIVPSAKKGTPLINFMMDFISETPGVILKHTNK